MCPISNGCEDTAEVVRHMSDFCLWGWMKSEVYKEKVNTRDESYVYWTVHHLDI